MTKSLVAYFSASGVTKEAAMNLANVTGSDMYEIRPAVPYTGEDLNWTDKNSRSSIEMSDKYSRPEMVEDDFSVAEYGIIFLGFPIWWYIAPTIINTFLEKHDFSNKKIILFATSGGSGFGGTVENLRPSVDSSAEIVEGKILNYSPSAEDIESWVMSIK